MTDSPTEPRELVLRRFPFVSFLLSTSVLPADVHAVVVEGLRQRDGSSLSLADSAKADEALRLTYEEPGLGFLRVAVTGAIVASARGSNVYVRVGGGWLWPPLQLTLYGTTLAGFVVSYRWRELLLLPWVSLPVSVICTSFVWFVGEHVAEFFAASLPD